MTRVSQRQAEPWSRKMSATSRAGRTRQPSGALRWRLLVSSLGVVMARSGAPADLSTSRILGGDARVASRGLELGMSEQNLDHPNIMCCSEKMGGEAMAKRMRRERFAQPADFRQVLEQPV